ncbi:MAG: TIGR01212 family radical SAM protein, partial [Fusobacteriaceae bacterium]
EAGTWGIKIHSLYVVVGTKLHELFLAGKIFLPTEEEYVETCVEILKSLPPEVVVHRLTGDGKKSKTVAPIWNQNKIKILNEINKKIQ